MKPWNPDAEIDDLNIKNADDPTLGLTNVGGKEPEDWAADTGQTRIAEGREPAAWDQFRATAEAPRDTGARRLQDMRRKPATIEQALIDDLQDLYQVESEQEHVLDRLASAASSEELKTAFRDHLNETRQQVQRLSQILEGLGESAGGSGMVPAGVAGLVEEANEKMDRFDNPNMRDLAIIAEAQKIEHNEISCYGTARAMAHTLGRDEEAHLLQATLDEEEQADKKLTLIALKLLKEADATVTR